MKLDKNEASFITGGLYSLDGGYSYSGIYLLAYIFWHISKMTMKW